MPGPMLINLKYEAEDLGVDLNVDLYSGLPPPEKPKKADSDSEFDSDSDSETIMLDPQLPAEQSSPGASTLCPFTFQNASCLCSGRLWRAFKVGMSHECLQRARRSKARRG
jgi:hypothetical protein